MPPDDKSQRRVVREQAVKTFNGLAEVLELPPLAYRPTNPAIQSLFKELCAKVDADQLSSLKTARDESKDPSLPEFQKACRLASVMVPSCVGKLH